MRLLLHSVSGSGGSASSQSLGGGGGGGSWIHTGRPGAVCCHHREGKMLRIFPREKCEKIAAVYKYIQLHATSGLHWWTNLIENNEGLTSKIKLIYIEKKSLGYNHCQWIIIKYKRSFPNSVEENHFSFFYILSVNKAYVSVQSMHTVHRTNTRSVLQENRFMYTVQCTMYNVHTLIFLYSLYQSDKATSDKATSDKATIRQGI